MLKALYFVGSRYGMHYLAPIQKLPTRIMFKAAIKNII